MNKAAPFDDLAGWLAALGHPAVLVELGALLLCVVLAWVMFPFVLLCLAYGARTLLAHVATVAVFRIALPVLIALVVIRVGVKVLQAAFSDTPLVRVLERSISWMAWVAMVLWVSGLLPLMLEELDQIHWKVGGAVL